MRIEVNITTPLVEADIKKIATKLSKILSKNHLSGEVRFYPTRVKIPFGFVDEDDDMDFGLGKPTEPLRELKPTRQQERIKVPVGTPLAPVQRDVEREDVYKPGVSPDPAEKTTVEFKRPSSIKQKGNPFLSTEKALLPRAKKLILEMDDSGEASSVCD